MTQFKEIELSNPIISGKTEINKISIRKPLAGDLRGVKLADFINSDIDSLAKVLPRITTPTLSDQDVFKMELIDISNVMGVVGDFLTPNSESASKESPTE